MASPIAAASSAIVNLYAPAASSVAVTVAASPQTPHSLLAWAEANPTLAASFVPALVGILTVIGVIVSLWSSRRNADSDRKHSASEADKDRTALMRREVYLDAVGSLIEAQNYLSSLPKQDIAKINLFDGLLGLQKAVSKIAIVAEQETALKARALSGRYGLFLLQALPILLPLGEARSKRDLAEINHKESRAQVARVLMEKTLMVEQGIKDETRWNALDSAFNFHQNWAQTHAEAIDAAYLKMSESEMDYLKIMRDEVLSLVFELDDIACLIRKELSIETDVKAFHAQTKEIQEKMSNAFDDILKLWDAAHEAHVQRVAVAEKAAAEKAAAQRR
jgi:hypothetical protein